MSEYNLELKAQHDSILKTLTETINAWQSKDFVSLEKTLSTLVSQLNKHNQAELDILFKNIPDEKLKQGGPFCSLYFDFFMNNRPFRISEMYISELEKQDFKIIPEPFFKPFFDRSSLLTIPIEEHIAAIAIAKSLLKNIKTAPEDSFSKSLYYLNDLLKQNFRKEETCLWEVARLFLQPQTTSSKCCLVSSRTRADEEW